MCLNNINYLQTNVPSCFIPCLPHHFSNHSAHVLVQIHALGNNNPSFTRFSRYVAPTIVHAHGSSEDFNLTWSSLPTQHFHINGIYYSPSAVRRPQKLRQHKKIHPLHSSEEPPSHPLHKHQH